MYRWTFLCVVGLLWQCIKANQHCYANQANANSCKTIKKCKWGYEDSCHGKQWFQTPICTEKASYRSFRSMDEKIRAFWEETDFGYVRSASPSKYLCQATKKGDSSLYCNDKVTYCHGKNVYMDLRDGQFPFKSGKDSKISRKKKYFGGSCTLENTTLLQDTMYDTGLISWSRHLQHFQSLKFQPTNDKHCDITVETPTFFVELDSIGNMYHHFCDFFNLYIAKHIYGSLRKDVEIAIWEQHPRMHFGPFRDTWKLFTSKDVYSLGGKFAGKRVCFKDVIFSLLPRMASGMYYSTPVIDGCSHSGLFRAFSKYITTGFKVKQERKSKTQPLRVTLLLRVTEYRNILNKNELIKIMQAEPGITVREVTFDWNVPFSDQLKISHNTDLLIGIHGAGLAHTLFLPNWGTLFELYNTNDIRCYHDLARLRGVSYITWEKNEKIESSEETARYRGNDKFRNFRFDTSEFKRMLQNAINISRKNLASYFTS